MKTEVYLWMEQYLNDELSSEEKQLFEQKLQEDKSFKKEFELFKDLYKTYDNRIGNAKKTAQLKNTLAQLGNQYIKKEESNKDTKVISLSGYAKYFVAASLLLLAGIIFLKKGKPTYSDYTNFDKMEVTVRSTETNEHLIKAADAFNTKNYKEAAKELEILLKEDKTKVTLQLYLAVSLMEQNEYKKAEKILKKISKSDSVYKSKALWYLALSKLKQQDYKACAKYLKRIQKGAPEYDDAQGLLKQL